MHAKLFLAVLALVATGASPEPLPSAAGIAGTATADAPFPLATSLDAATKAAIAKVRDQPRPGHHRFHPKRPGQHAKPKEVAPKERRSADADADAEAGPAAAPDTTEKVNPAFRAFMERLEHGRLKPGEQAPGTRRLTPEELARLPKPHPKGDGKGDKPKSRRDADADADASAPIEMTPAKDDALPTHRVVRPWKVHDKVDPRDEEQGEEVDGAEEDGMEKRGFTDPAYLDKLDTDKVQQGKGPQESDNRHGCRVQ